jgi:TRIAD3 protein (E3 ubiquitin-protein ligase RNF216)
LVVLPGEFDFLDEVRVLVISGYLVYVSMSDVVDLTQSQEEGVWAVPIRETGVGQSAQPVEVDEVGVDEVADRTQGPVARRKKRRRRLHPDSFVFRPKMVVSLLDGQDAGNTTFFDWEGVATTSEGRSISLVEDDDFPIECEQSSAQAPRPTFSPIAEVLRVFPLAEPGWVKAELSKLCHDMGTCRMCFPMLLARMTEETFPTVEPSKPAADVAAGTVDYRCVDKERRPKPSSSYKDATVSALQLEFPNVPTAFIKKAMRRNHSFYLPTKMFLANAKTGTDYRPIKTERKQKSVTHVDSELMKEMKWAVEQEKQKKSEIDQILLKWEHQKKSFPRDAHGFPIIPGNIAVVECGACCEEIIPEAAVHCTEGHAFCGHCLKRYAQEEVFSRNRADLKCMHQGGQCIGVFKSSETKRALPIMTHQKYELTIARKVMETAKIKDLVQCPFCDAAAILPEGNNIFSCPNSACQISSCRKCKRRSHIPLKCDEVDEEKEVSARQKIEERMTAAKVRQCPKCPNKFFKSEGCNKMTCSCGAFVCYVCRKYIEPSVKYAHFCQTPHCKHKKCKKCPLYSNHKEDDERAVREAGISAAEEALLDLKEFYADTSKAEDVMANISKQANQVKSGGPKKKRSWLSSLF